MPWSKESRPSDLTIAGLVLLACMLITGQGLISYFVINRKGQISSLEKTADLKIKLTQKPRGSSSGSVVYNTPLLMMETTEIASKKKTPMKKLEDTVTVSVQKQMTQQKHPAPHPSASLHARDRY
ncbi:hypothetical protein SKAU_G00365220 [Synaphobranchus kaupii]|uniref:MHC class II-associated invariant chain/CLIP MHC II-interacting domain-containing protein n=1 Tax=Synaphobranchus kaupii TaxID=118154 RepID=A0A9Q1EF13_SYNKA|nr:hypothetical protein SKAU_G00365220 [Synaphobranchus kaupii]